MERIFCKAVWPGNSDGFQAKSTQPQGGKVPQESTLTCFKQPGKSRSFVRGEERGLTVEKTLSAGDLPESDGPLWIMSNVFTPSGSAFSPRSVQSGHMGGRRKQPRSLRRRALMPGQAAAENERISGLPLAMRREFPRILSYSQRSRKGAHAPFQPAGSCLRCAKRTCVSHEVKGSPPHSRVQRRQAALR